MRNGERDLELVSATGQKGAVKYAKQEMKDWTKTEYRGGPCFQKEMGYKGLDWKRW